MEIASSSFLRRPLFVSLTGLVSFLALTACFASGQSAHPRLDEHRGKASYYADEFEGETTANGETFDPSQMTAAHRDLPFGTRVRVTRIGAAEEQSVVVRINDRGPFKDNRIIDLSEAAARELGMMGKGVVEVRLDIVEETEGDASERSGRDDEEKAGW